jgi:membrane-anchored mycosin MYCP
MSKSPWNIYGGPYVCEHDQIVVTNEHTSLVKQELSSLDIGHSVDRTSDLLGLELLGLENVEAAKDALLKAEEAFSGGRSTPPPDSGLPLDTVLWSLRRIFGERYSGWAPSMGKNRFVGQVHGVGEVSHGGGGDPTMAVRPDHLAPRSTGPGRGVRVGLLDTQLYPQPWLAGGWTARYSDTLDLSRTRDLAAGHATFITGLILSQAPGATVEVHHVLDSSGMADSWSVAEEIVNFGQTGLDVLNLSFVSYTEDGEAPLVLATAIDRLDPRIVVVAAAGNHGALEGRNAVKPAWPAALDDVIAVGAADDDGQIADFTPNAPWVDVLAKGVAVRSTYLEGFHSPHGDSEFEGWATWNGTSFAAALVSGAIAAGTTPGRVHSPAAATDILRAVSRVKPVGNTLAGYLPLRTW